MKRSPSSAWVPRYGYSNALVDDLCAVADARARVELLPLPADESLRLRFAAYQRSTRSSTRIEGNPLDDQAVRVVSLPRFQGQCLESCFYTDPMKTNDHNEFPFYATPLQR